MHDLHAGERIGDYRVRRVLGRGGAGTVYEVDGPSGPVAVKLMHEQDPSGVGRKRFDREAALVQKLRHPHVVALLGFGHEAGLPYIVFELLNGRSLKSMLRREGPFDAAGAGRMVLQMLEALMAAHAMGIIHRDIKPANVYICDDQGPDFVKVLDFGLAKALEGEGAEVATITDTGYRLGTPRYMSPEMARGQQVGEAGDIYSLGLVFAEMLSGSPVVQATSQIDVMMAHANDDQLELDEAITHSPFAQCIRQSLAKNPAQRFATATAMHDAVKTALHYHEQALQIAQRFPDAPADAATLLYDGSKESADPLLATEEIDPTPAMPARQQQAPAALAATMAFPEGFDPSTIPQARAAPTMLMPPTVPVREAPPTLMRPPTTNHTGMRITLAVVIVLIVAGVAAAVMMLR